MEVNKQQVESILKSVISSVIEDLNLDIKITDWLYPPHLPSLRSTNPGSGCPEGGERPFAPALARNECYAAGRSLGPEP